METSNSLVGESNLKSSNSLDSPQQSDVDSPPLEMTVVLNNEINPYWANDTPLRCASNADLNGKKAIRDFKIQVIEVRNGPRWFVFPSNKSENEEANQSPSTNGCSDQENLRDNNNSVRRSMRLLNRRKVSSEFNNANPSQQTGDFVPYEEDLCKATVTNQSTNAPMSEPTTRRINKKPMDSRFQVTNASLSASPPSTSSEYSSMSNQSTLSSCASETFQILAVATKCESEDEDEFMEPETNSSTPDCSKQTGTNPLILVSHADPQEHA